MSGKNKNDLAWEAILGELTYSQKNLDENGYFDIESEVIKRHREPRLACKIDYRQNMPEPLKKEKLSVLAIKNKHYRIARTDPFINVSQKQCRGSKLPDHFRIPEHIQALTPQNISSESKALDAAFVSGMLDDVVGDELAPVLRGREYCQRIDFSLPDRENNKLVDYEVEKVQLEVDGGYEGQTGIHLFEAKLSLSNNMNLRQLLYPQLHYEELFHGQKDVKTYVMFYEPGRGYFHFYRFRTDEKYYFSDYRRCALEETSSCNFFWESLNAVKVDENKTGYGAPFPQADRLDKVLVLFMKLYEAGSLTKEKLFSTYNIVPRQYDYYVNALRWMGLVEENTSDWETKYQLTRNGAYIAKKPDREILVEMAKIIFSNDLCNHFVNNLVPNIPKSIKSRNGLSNSDSTFRRRMQTIKSWRKYFQEIFPHKSFSQ